jgi:hypothetical protein
MKKTLWLLVYCAFSAIHVHCAEKDNNKFGKITEEEVKMNSFAPDTSAAAVVLYEKGSTYYQVTRGLQVNFDIYVKIKILKPEGVNRANVKILYEDYGLDNREVVQGIDGYSYNYVNGKVEKSRLSKDFIFTENVKEKLFQKKFTLPNVKPGTLIEYKYTVVSDFLSHIRAWRFQQEIPVCQSICDVLIPEYFTFNINTRGYYPIASSKEPENQTFVMPGGTSSCSSEHIILKVKDLPALKKEKYVSYMNDYCSSVSFEISGIQIPGQVYKSYSYTWKDVEKQLMDGSDFGGNLKKSGLLKEEVKAIKDSKLTDEEKIKQVYALVKSKVKWNENISMYNASLKKALKDGVGNSADINFILINVLKDAGYDAYPIVMSSKSEGRLPHANPSINSINYFVVGVDVNGTQYYMDATRKNASVNILDDEYMVDRARALRGVEGNLSDWVDLSHINASSERNNSLIKFENGKMIVTVYSVKSNQLAYNFREKYKKYKNQDEWVETLQNNYGVSIDSYQVTDLDSINKPVVEKFTFSKPASLDDAKLYVNLLTLFQEKANPFTAEKRELPVEFDFPYTVKNTISIMIPQGYVVDEVPKSEKTAINDKDATYTYLVQNGEAAVQMIASLTMNQLIYPGNEYANLRDFWSRMVAKNNEQVVLKKATM